MYADIIKQRLSEYRATNEIEEENALKEILQEVILAALFELGFFGQAAFHGGTSLRIFYGLNRFSEDLDFALLHKNADFDWNKTQKSLEKILYSYGIDMKVKDQSTERAVVQKALVTTTKVGKILTLRRPNHENKAIKIKLKVDTNPPEYASFTEQLLTFPFSAYVRCHDLNSCFAGKAHALLCRKFVKGRDWFDLAWYANKRFQPNLKMLEAAIYQTGPWSGKKIKITPEWLTFALTEKIESMNWNNVRQDVERFVSDKDRKVLQMWNTQYFLQIVNKIGQAST
jgi:predicted nucleotidyltransferase component of viral defense system